MPEEILILDKKAKKALETTLIDVINTMHPFLVALAKSDDPKYKKIFHETLLSLAGETQEIQVKLNKGENVTFKEFAELTQHLTNMNKRLKEYDPESEKTKFLARIGAQVLPTGADAKSKENNPMHHQSTQESMEKVMQKMGAAVLIINEHHHSTREQKTVLQALLSGLKMAIPDRRPKAVQPLRDHHLTRKTSEHSIGADFKDELQKRMQATQEKHQAKENQKPPSPSP